MAINVSTQDLLNYPGIVKTVSVNQESVVPQLGEGDEQFVLNFSTSAYSDAVARTRIQDYYITNFKSGWCKSSGFAGNKFALDSTHCSLEIKVDATTSGISDGYYRITLDHNAGIPIDAEVVAADMQTKIRALASSFGTADVGYILAYKNTTVEYTGGRLWIVSGSLSEYYTGTNKSAVRVRASSENDCSEILGFNLETNSEIMDSIDIKEALVLSDYTTSGTGEITISANIGIVANDCLMITDRTNTDYFQVDSVVGGTLVTFNAAKVTHNYASGASKIQLLREADPESSPTLWFDDVDKVTRHGIRVMISQIDYSA